MNRTILLAVFLACIALPAIAQDYEPIAGAFGWTLGEPPSAASKALLGEPWLVSDGKETYHRVIPPEAVRFFDVYKVITAPDKGPVAAILGFGSYGDPELENLARKDYQELVSILEAKYGPSTETMPEGWAEKGYKEIWSVSRDGREVNAFLRQLSDNGWQVYVEYYDWDLYNSLEQEAASKEADAL